MNTLAASADLSLPPDSAAVLTTAAAWRRAGRGVALATVVNTWGSSPRPVGSMLAVDERSHMIGSVSGGCVEGAVASEALAAIEDGKPRLLSFGVSDDQAWEVGLACGGEVRVLVERLNADQTAGAGMHLGTVDQVAQALASKRSLALAIRLRDAAQRVIEPGPGTALAEAAAAAIRSDRSQTLDWDGEEWFVQAFNPPLRLLIVGAVHIAQVLAPMARMLGYAVTVVDPRSAFATEARFPDTDLLRQWPDKALSSLAPDARSAVVTLSHDPKLDDPGLVAALASEAFYIGALGSRRTHARRVERLQELGFDAERLARIRGPAGLDLGARSPAEIALSVLAQMTESLRRPEPA